MTAFDLIFIAVFFAIVGMLVATAVAASRGRGRRAVSILRRLGICIAAYLAIVVIVSLTSPPRVLHMNEPQCFDDWCISVDRVERTAAGADVSYAVTLRLFSRARGRPQRENGVSVYLLDDHGRRYQPTEDPQAVPLNVQLNPGESRSATRRFLLPTDAHNPGLVVAHGWFPGMFIIADGQSFLHKPTVVDLQQGKGSLDISQLPRRKDSRAPAIRQTPGRDGMTESKAASALSISLLGG